MYNKQENQMTYNLDMCLEMNGNTVGKQVCFRGPFILEPEYEFKNKNKLNCLMKNYGITVGDQLSAIMFAPKINHIETDQ